MKENCRENKLSTQTRFMPSALCQHAGSSGCKTRDPKSTTLHYDYNRIDETRPKMFTHRSSLTNHFEYTKKSNTFIVISSSITEARVKSIWKEIYHQNPINKAKNTLETFTHLSIDWIYMNRHVLQITLIPSSFRRNQNI